MGEDGGAVLLWEKGWKRSGEIARGENKGSHCSCWPMESVCIHSVVAWRVSGGSCLV